MHDPPVNSVYVFLPVGLVVFQLSDANLVFRPPISYVVLASFFAISTLRLTGHEVARGLRYRYGEKIAL